LNPALKQVNLSLQQHSNNLRQFCHFRQISVFYALNEVRGFSKGLVSADGKFILKSRMFILDE
jgi:hypothetical protein